LLPHAQTITIIPQWQALSTPQLKVQDTLQSLGDIAGFYRSRLQQTKVVAITFGLWI